MRELISVVIPLYNAEKSIERCINSILCQKGIEFEIIIVDDGSDDHSFEICKKMEKLYKEITIYHTENRGVSHARNIGIEKANGKWIVFVDADDELVNNALLASMEMQKRYLCDTVCWNMVSITSKGSQPYERFRMDSNLVSKCEIEDLLSALYNIPSKKNYFYGTLIRGACGKMYLLEIINKNKIKFIDGMIMGEDAAFLFEYFNACELIAFLDKPLYKYYELGDSVTKRYKKNLFLIQKKEAIVIKKLYRKYGMDPEEAMIHFWNISFMEYIRNEYKICQNDWKVLVKANKYLQNEIVRKYMIKNKSARGLSKIKSFLIKHRFTLAVSYIYIQICKK